MSATEGAVGGAIGGAVGGAVADPIIDPNRENIPLGLLPGDNEAMEWELGGGAYILVERPQEADVLVVFEKKGRCKGIPSKTSDSYSGWGNSTLSDISVSVNCELIGNVSQVATLRYILVLHQIIFSRWK